MPTCWRIHRHSIHLAVGGSRDKGQRVPELPEGVDRAVQRGIRGGRSGRRSHAKAIGGRNRRSDTAAASSAHCAARNRDGGGAGGIQKRKLAFSFGGPVSRTLFSRRLAGFSRHFFNLSPGLRRAPPVASLGLRRGFPQAGCDIPETIGRAAQSPILSCTRRGFSAVCPRGGRGGLLPHLFHPYPVGWVAPPDGIFSVTLSVTAA